MLAINALIIFNLLIKCSFGVVITDPLSPEYQNNSLCVLPHGKKVFGVSNCSNGNVVLMGTYMNVGIDSAASLGTVPEVVKVDYFDTNLALIADFDKNGWDTQPFPSYSGDFFTPGVPLEGKTIYLV